MGTKKDKWTNVIAAIVGIAGLVQAIGQAVNGHLESVNDVNWPTLVLVVGTVVIAWFTGKDSNGKPKV